MDRSDSGDAPPYISPRRRMLTIGLPAVLIVAAVGILPFVVGGDGDDAIRTADAQSTTTVAETTTDGTQPAAVFTSVPGTSGTLPGTSPTTTRARPTTTRARPTTTRARPTTTTTATTTTSSTTTTSTAPPTIPETVPAQQAQPIAPPADPRAPEEQVRLGGISIPKLGVDAPLLEGIRLTTLDNGPGHWPGTAMPGQVGNVVVAAHRTSHGATFRHIDQLAAGDQVFFDVDGGRFEYTVTGTQVVDPSAVWIVDPTDTPTATLFACHPPGSVSQRIVVKLELAA